MVRKSDGPARAQIVAAPANAGRSSIKLGADAREIDDATLGPDHVRTGTAWWWLKSDGPNDLTGFPRRINEGWSCQFRQGMS